MTVSKGEHEGSDVEREDKLEHDREVVRNSAQETAIMIAAVRERSENYQAPSIAPLGVVLLIVVAAFLMLSPLLYPYSVTGMYTGLRDTAVGIPLGLAAFSLRSQLLPHPPAVGVAGLIGVALIIFGFLLNHNNTGAAFGEIACGVLVLLGCLMQLDRRG